jgi:hypothetical protein
MNLCVLICWIATLSWNKTLNWRSRLNQIIAYHVESTPLNDEDYELVPETEQGFSEDPVNIVETLTEALNQSSEIFDTPAPSPAQEGKPRCIIQYFKLLHLYNLICIYYILH